MKNMENMKNYEVGDRFVIEIDKVFSQDGETLYRVKGMKSLVFDEYGLNILEPLSAYTDLLETKIRRQAAEITRLLSENEELKKGLESDRDGAFEAGRIVGNEEARELMIKMGNMYCYDLEKIFGSSEPWDIITNLSYQKSAAKVAEWEKAKEEICVGDVVRFKSNNRAEFCVTDILDNSFLYGISAEGGVYADRDIKLLEKTGRHIDVDAWLAQIGGDCND